MPNQRNGIVRVVDELATKDRVVRFFFRSFGCHHMIEAGDAAGAAHIPGKGPVDRILSDWDWRKMTGIAWPGHIRSTGGFKDFPFLMLALVA